MAMKRGSRVRPSTVNARFAGRHRRGRIAIALAAMTATCLLAASPALADTGSVYFDANGNAAAGGTFFPFGFGGFRNVGLGAKVFPNLLSAADNVAVGDGALNADTGSQNDIAIGSNALSSMVAGGNQNIAIGSQALNDSTTGDNNIATGFQALSSNTIGNDNIAAGANALNDNTSGDENLALGRGALTNAELANDNIAIGLHALFANTTGLTNTALGDRALDSNTGGDQNLALGAGAGANLTTGNDNIDLANPGQAGEAGTIRIGTQGGQTRAFMQGISGTALSGSTQRVLINANGQLGTAKAATRKPGGAGAKSASADRKLRAKVNRLQRAVRQLRAEVAQGH